MRGGLQAVRERHVAQGLTPLPRFPSCGGGGFGAAEPDLSGLAAAYRISARQDTVYQRGYPCVQLCILYICRIFMGGGGIAQYPHNFMFGQNIAVIERQKQ